MCPLLTETGPIGHVEDFTIDLELKVARCCICVHDILIRECVVPLDVEVPYWGFNEKFVMVGYTLLIPFRSDTQLVLSAIKQQTLLNSFAHTLKPEAQLSMIAFVNIPILSIQPF